MGELVDGVGWWVGQPRGLPLRGMVVGVGWLVIGGVPFTNS